MYGILDDGIKFARWIGKSATTMAAKALVFLAMVLSFAMETATTLQWLYLTEIPRRILTLLDTVKQWATPLIISVRDALRSALNSAVDWTRRQINGLIDTARSLRDWASGHINEIRNYLDNTVKKWYDRLTDPAKFAEWIVGAIANALLRYAYTNRDKIARYLLESSPAATSWLARQIEAIIGRLL